MVSGFFCQDHSQQAVEQDLKPSSLTVKPVLLTERRRVQVTSSEWPTGQALNGRLQRYHSTHWGKPRPSAEKPNVTEQGK